jgi:hypothetical protein
MHLARLSLMATNLQPIIIMELNLMCSNEKDFNSFRFDNINSPQLAGATDLLIQTDIGLGQILYALTKDKFDGLVKSPKNANFQISHLMISIGYETEI